MTLRYMAIVSHDQAHGYRLRSACAGSAKLHEILVTDVLSIFATEINSHYRYAHGSGVILGDVFSRCIPSEQIAPSCPVLLKASHTDLVHDYWGGYIAFHRDRGTGVVEIQRDPSGALPCYYLNSQGLTIIASDVGLLRETGFLKPEINWPELTRFLMAPDLPTPATCLIGLRELLAGSRLSMGAGQQTVSTFWSPWDFVARTPLANIRDAVMQVRQVTSDCVRAWADRYAPTLLGVSGGLDSSIIATILKNSNHDISAYSIATDEPEGDERSYARILTDYLDIPLIEAFHCLEDIDLHKSMSAHLPRPRLPGFGRSDEKTKFSLAASVGAKSIFSGIGGDNAFCSMRSASPAVDRLRVEGPSLGTIRTLRDICHLTGASFGEVAGAAITKHMSGRARYPWHTDVRFLSSAASDISGEFSHPWLQLDPRNHTLPGKLAHVAMLVRIQGSVDGYARDKTVPFVLPLLSQPIIETCLSIPTWAWVEAGDDRAVARQAFADVLPPAIRHRRSKGGPNSFACAVIETNRRQLREFLLSGHLAQQGLLDIERLGQVLDDQWPIRPPDHMTIGRLAEAEAWCRSMV